MVLVAVAAATCWSAAAHAHAAVTATEPRAGVIVDSAPSEVVVEFSEPVSTAQTDTAVIAPGGSNAHSDPAVADGSDVRIPLRADLPEGTYLVTYRVISSDGHPVASGFTFSIGAASPAPEPPEPETAGAVAAGAKAANQYLGYLGLALTLGPALLLIAGGFGSRRVAARWIAAGLSTIAATAVASLYLQAAYVAGRGLWDVSGDDVGVVLHSSHGSAVLARLLIVAAALPLLARAVAEPSLSGSRRWMLGAAAAGLTLTWPWAGHAAASTVPAVTVVADTIHLGAAGLWIGGLASLFFLLLARRRREADAESVLPVWSRWATWLLAALALAGACQAVIEVRSLEGLLSTLYGRLVLAKLVLFALVLATAAAARAAVRRDAGGLRRRVRRMVGVELAIVAVVLGVTAVLTQTPPASTALAESAAEQRRDSAQLLETRHYSLHFDLGPAAVGTNAVELRLYSPEGEKLEPLEWEATFANPDADIAPVDMNLTSTAHRATAEAALPESGDWEFSFRIRTTEWDRASVSTVVSIP